MVRVEVVKRTSVLLEVEHEPDEEPTDLNEAKRREAMGKADVECSPQWEIDAVTEEGT